MKRHISLHQIEIFKATIEHGTVSRASEAISISQPAASKLLTCFEENTGLKLFERNRSRLIPTKTGLTLYEEIDRIFSGIREVENAIAAVKREDQGQLSIGVLPALSGSFIQRITAGFLQTSPNVYCSIKSTSSQRIVESIRNRKLDVGIVSSRVNDRYLSSEPLGGHPLVCIMPINHPLAEHEVIKPENLNETPFISFNGDSYTEQKITAIFQKYKVKPNIVLSANTGITIRQFVAAGLGVSLVHPLFVTGIEEQLVVRTFEPLTPIDFLLCFAKDARDLHLVSNYVEETKFTATHLIHNLVN